MSIRLLTFGLLLCFSCNHASKEPSITGTWKSLPDPSMQGRNIEERLTFFKSDSFRTIVSEDGSQLLEKAGTYKLNLSEKTLLMEVGSQTIPLSLTTITNDSLVFSPSQGGQKTAYIRVTGSR
jgi:hypothetical protein